MKKQKIIILIFFIIMIIVAGCKPYKNEEVNIRIIEYPKLTYYENEEYDFSNLKVAVCYQNGEEKIIDNYQLEYDDKIVGNNEIKIIYNDFIISFIIEVIENKTIDIIQYSNYQDKTSINFHYNDYTFKYDNVYYGQYRDTNMFIVYDEYQKVNTNIYGYEASVDKNGKVVEVGTNVDLIEGGMVLSAHGIRKVEIENINVGDYILYIDNTIYVYKELMISEYNDIFIRFYQYLNVINKVTDINEYNTLVTKLNEIIPLLNKIYQDDNSVDINILNDFFKKLDFNPYDHKTVYTENNTIYQPLELNDLEIDNTFNYSLSSIYEGKFYVGGFRNENSLVLYDKEHFSNRNNTGYEVGVNKEGIVVSKDVLVDLEEDGYILSGHTSAMDFIINNIQLNDKIEIIDNKVYVYRDYLKNSLINLINQRNILIKYINEALSNKEYHDYDYINVMINHIDNILKEYDCKDLSIYNLNLISKNIKTIEEYIAIVYSLLIEYDNDNIQGMWYYPFEKLSVYDDTSYEGIINTLNRFKDMGINEIVIRTFVDEECLFDSTIFNKYNKLENYDYGEYGNDYLKCFIEESHKRNIKVNAFTQTFMEHIDNMKNGSEDFYLVDYQGNKNSGLLDICNDNVQNQLITYYKEIVSQYNFDKIEYDIIRYPSSNLYKYLEVDIIPNNVKITDYGYSEYSMNKFMELYQLTGDLKQLIVNNKEVRTNWLLFKEQELVNFISECTDEMRKINKNIVVTAAVLNNVNVVKKQYLQDYEKWLSIGIVDEIEIMCYTFSLNYLNNWINDASDLMNEYSVRIGISSRLEGNSLIADFSQMMLASKKEGFIIFSSNLYTNDYIYKIMKLSNINY